MSADSLRAYQNQVAATQTSTPGMLTKKEGGPILKASGLNMKQLKSIWLLCDTLNSGKLNEQQFVVCLHLLACVQRGAVLPPKLPLPLETYISTGIYKDPSQVQNSVNFSQNGIQQQEIQQEKESEIITEFKKFQKEAAEISKKNQEQIEYMRTSNREALESAQSELDSVSALVASLKVLYPSLIKENQVLESQLNDLKKARVDGEQAISTTVEEVCTKASQKIQESNSIITKLTSEAQSLKSTLQKVTTDKIKLTTENATLQNTIDELQVNAVNLNFGFEEGQDAEEHSAEGGDNDFFGDEEEEVAELVAVKETTPPVEEVKKSEEKPVGESNFFEEEEEQEKKDVQTPVEAEGQETKPEEETGTQEDAENTQSDFFGGEEEENDEAKGQEGKVEDLKAEDAEAVDQEDAETTEA